MQKWNHTAQGRANHSSKTRNDPLLSNALHAVVESCRCRIAPEYSFHPKFSIYGGILISPVVKGLGPCHKSMTCVEMLHNYLFCCQKILKFGYPPQFSPTKIHETTMKWFPIRFVNLLTMFHHFGKP